MRLVAKLAAAVAAASVAYTGVSYAAQSSPIVVDRVIDGDTIDVWMLGKTVRVRLLNIDTPETKDPGQAPECLGPEAASFLEERLPPGTRVELGYDQERYDRYGRTLAGVYEAGKLVNAEVAAAGLGAPVVFEPNRRFYPEVLAAAQQAEARQVGSYALDVECTLPSQVGSAVAALAASETFDDNWTADDHLNAIGVIDQAVSRATTLRSLLTRADSDDDPSANAFHPDHQRALWVNALDQRIADGSEQRQAHQTAIEQIRTAERVAKEKAEAKRIAKEKAKAKRIAKEKAEAKRIAKQKAAAAKKKDTSSMTRISSSGSSSRGGYPGYTGPRCYAPGGKTWKPC